MRRHIRVVTLLGDAPSTKKRAATSCTRKASIGKQAQRWFVYLRGFGALPCSLSNSERAIRDGSAAAWCHNRLVAHRCLVLVQSLGEFTGGHLLPDSPCGSTTPPASAALSPTSRESVRHSDGCKTAREPDDWSRISVTVWPNFVTSSSSANCPVAPFQPKRGMGDVVAHQCGTCGGNPH